MPLISESVREAHITQLAMEKYNANLYLSIASFLKGKGFDNISKHFENQHNEEETHALMLYKLLTDLNEIFCVPAIDDCSLNITTIEDIGVLYLQREIETTNSLKEIRLQSSDENEGGCPVVETRMIEMLKLQQDELAEATTFFDKAKIIGDDWKTALLWDASLE